MRKIQRTNFCARRLFANLLHDTNSLDYLRACDYCVARREPASYCIGTAVHCTSRTQELDNNNTPSPESLHIKYTLRSTPCLKTTATAVCRHGSTNHHQHLRHNPLPALLLLQHLQSLLKYMPLRMKMLSVIKMLLVIPPVLILLLFKVSYRCNTSDFGHVLFQCKAHAFECTHHAFELEHNNSIYAHIEHTITLE